MSHPPLEVDLREAIAADAHVLVRRRDHGNSHGHVTTNSPPCHEQPSLHVGARRTGKPGAAATVFVRKHRTARPENRDHATESAVPVLALRRIVSVEATVIAIKMPRTKHKNHLCHLRALGYVQANLEGYERPIREGQFICVTRGRVARDAENLCVPEKLQGKQSLP